MENHQGKGCIGENGLLRRRRASRGNNSSGADSRKDRSARKGFVRKGIPQGGELMEKMVSPKDSTR
jgi:hypothetical protein